VIFIDDCSSKSCIYFLKTKNETFDKLKEFKALVENQIGRHIRILRSDNGGEFESHHFDYLCREEGIKRELLVPYNPQHNGVVERKNKTICEVAKAMLCDLDLPLSLWAEAASTAVYIQNKIRYAILGEKTPKEVFTGKKSAVDPMRIFGTFVGYRESSKAYHIYFPGQRYI
jgi:transposase InsO family protein